MQCALAIWMFCSVPVCGYSWSFVSLSQLSICCCTSFRVEVLNWQPGIYGTDMSRYAELNGRLDCRRLRETYHVTTHLYASEPGGTLSSLLPLRRPHPRRAPCLALHPRINTPLKKRNSFWRTLTSKACLSLTASPYRLTLKFLPPVKARVREIEELLVDAQDQLRIHGESLIGRLPRAVRNITLAEFAKYKGDVQDYIKATKRDARTEQTGIDRTTLKRKWVASQEEVNAAAGPSGSRDAESSRGLKSGAWHVSFVVLVALMNRPSAYYRGYA